MSRIVKPTLGELIDGRYRQHPRYRGCVGHWLMNEGGGSFIYDLCQINHATLTSGPTWSSGAFVGSAISLAGGTGEGVINTAPSSALKPTSSVTVSAWLNLANSTQTQKGIATLWYSEPSGSPWSCYSMSIQGGATPRGWEWSVNTGVGSTAIVGNLISVGWRHLVGTWDGANVILYENGKLTAGPTARSGTINYTATSSWRIGENDSGGETIVGKVDDVRVYNRALTPGEVLSLYQEPFLEFGEFDNRSAFEFDFPGQLRRSSSSRILQPYNLCEPFPGAP